MTILEFYEAFCRVADKAIDLNNYGLSQSARDEHMQIKSNIGHNMLVNLPENVNSQELTIDQKINCLTRKMALICMGEDFAS